MEWLRLKWSRLSEKVMSRESRTVEKTASSIERAIELCLMELGVSRREVEIEILDDARSGFLGMGGREARVRATLRSSEEQTEFENKLNRAPEVVEEDIEEEDIEEEDEATDEPVEEEAAAPEINPAVAEPPATAEVEKEAVEVDPIPEEKSAPAGDPAFDEFENLPDPELMDEMEIGEQVFGKMIDLLNLDVDIVGDISEADELGKQVVEFNLIGPDANLLLGQRGETMSNFQYLGRLMISQKLRRRSSIVVDVDGHRNKQRQGLEKLANRMAEKVIRRQKPVTLEPMNPYERRLIHVALRDNNKVYTQSVGDGRQRRVRIFPER